MAAHSFNSKHKYLSSSGFLPVMFSIILITGVSLCLIYSYMTKYDPLDTNFVHEGPKDLKLLTSQELRVVKGLSGETCPEHFRWIHEDLRPWKSSGISRDMVERAKETAHFRLVILKGKLYVEKLKSAFQTRDSFTIWGILQLIELYGDKVPDVELMFSCEDRPKINESYYYYQQNSAFAPPVLFQYCKRDGEFGVLFPDWTFWGWAEVNVKPWTRLIRSIKEGNKRIKWKDRQPYAYWKGNPYVNRIRPKLIKCNVSDEHDWNARLFKQNWTIEAKQGFKNSKLEDQCTYRYKIYAEGWGWSVSEKYILACDSMALFIKPEFFDFFTRSLQPMQHYWHIRPENLCKDIKLAVEWGNKHPDKAESIGKAGSQYIQENLKMKYVYYYMFHVLNEYAKLLRLKPTVPEGAVEVKPQTTLGSQNGTWKKFMEESMVKSPQQNPPCQIPPPYDSNALEAISKGKDNIYRAVDTSVDQYWNRQNKTGPYAMY